VRPGRPGDAAGAQKTDDTRQWKSFHRHLAMEMLVLSGLALQRPTVENPVIVTEPHKVASANEPVFPLRTRTVSQHRADSAPGL
jgi:hypothetical protein